MIRLKRNILEYVQEAAKKNPDKLAFSDTKIHLSFAQLQEYSQKVGTYIGELGICNKPIVIFMEKSPYMLAGFFGTVYSGNYYVPIDKEMPKSRIKLIFESLQPSLVIVDEKTEKIALEFCPEKEVTRFSSLLETTVNLPLLDGIQENALDIDPIYIIFTSGSTGVPKGVLVNHRSVIDYVEQLSQVLEVNEDTVFGNQSPLYVDACLKEIFPTLKFCATTYFIPKSLFMFPIKLIDFLNEYRINTVCWVVTAFTIISAYGGLEAKKLEHLRTVAFGSEVFPLKQFQLWRKHLPDAQFIHLYGPTEATGMSTYFKVDRDFQEGERIPIGKPFANTQIKLLSDQLTAVSPGEIGEICIRGTCLTMGYFQDAEKTSSSFIQNPEITAYQDLLYRTGDLGQYNDRGELLYISRKDHQIKHLGHRIELAEIEVAVSSMEGVKLACCVYQKEDTQLYLYYVGELASDLLIKQLKTLVPRYMVPYKATQVEEMPLTSNGKIDRNYLLNLSAQKEKNND